MADREEIRVPELGTPISHYTDAVRVGDLLFVSGCVPTDADGNVVGGDDVAAQARKTLENIGVILARRARRSPTWLRSPSFSPTSTTARRSTPCVRRSSATPGPRAR